MFVPRTILRTWPVSRSSQFRGAESGSKLTFFPRLPVKISRNTNGFLPGRVIPPEPPPPSEESSVSHLSIAAAGPRPLPPPTRPPLPTSYTTSASPPLPVLPASTMEPESISDNLTLLFCPASPSALRRCRHPSFSSYLAGTASRNNSIFLCEYNFAFNLFSPLFPSLGALSRTRRSQRP